jgi:cellulose synthase/poly-beta-1,6-N-acetylglucosamine synthase-like glycosyltransferase
MLIYVVFMFCIILFTAQFVIASMLFVFRKAKPKIKIIPPSEWPTVTIQLPIYNEKFVVRRLIDSVCSLDYPKDKLSIQVLDDSIDETTHIALESVIYYRAKGVNIELVHRLNRTGYKAGILNHGFKLSSAKYFVVFDADFMPSSFFLKQTIPQFFMNKNLGMLQTRWKNQNSELSWITMIQDIMWDIFLVIEQTVRDSNKLLKYSYGSAVIWRRECIEDAGGWQSDTVVEDLDLSYRSQLKGWESLYDFNIHASAELSQSIRAFKQQQFRWVMGTIQVIRKLGIEIWSSALPITKKLDAFIRMSAFFAYPILTAFILVFSPIAIINRIHFPSTILLVVIFVVGFFIVCLSSQLGIYSNWSKRILYFPIFTILIIGISVNNSIAVVVGLCQKRIPFMRTPKTAISNVELTPHLYIPQMDWVISIELIIWIITMLLIINANQHLPEAVPLLLFFGVSLGYVCLISILEKWIKIPITTFVAIINKKETP